MEVLNVIGIIADVGIVVCCIALIVVIMRRWK